MDLGVWDPAAHDDETTDYQTRKDLRLFSYLDTFLFESEEQ